MCHIQHDHLITYVASLHTLEKEDDLYEHIIDIKIPNMLDLPNEIRDKFCVIQADRLSRAVILLQASRPAQIQNGIQHIGTTDLYKRLDRASIV